MLSIPKNYPGPRNSIFTGTHSYPSSQPPHRGVTEEIDHHREHTSNLLRTETKPAYFPPE